MRHMQHISIQFRPYSVLLVCFAVLLIFTLLSVSIGATDFGLIDLVRIAWEHATSSASELPLSETVLLGIRIPRIIVAGICGSALAAAGVLSQGLFRNPLASPSILGTTAGASTGAALIFFLSSATLHWLSLPLAAGCGAMAATILILRLASLRIIVNLEQLLLAGFALNAFLAALTTLIVSLVLEDHQKFPALMYWLLGGLSAKGWTHVLIGIIPVFLMTLLAYRICAKLNVLTMGEEVAQTLSVDVAKLKTQTIVTVAVLVGTAVSLAGAITFVGLIIPHISRLLVGPEHKRLLIASMINGATLVIGADLIARTVIAPMELQVGVLIALCGAPFFFWLLIAQQRHLWQRS